MFLSSVTHSALVFCDGWKTSVNTFFIGPPSIGVSCTPDCYRVKAIDSAAAKSLEMEMSFKIQTYHGKRLVLALLSCYYFASRLDYSSSMLK